jgi:hypothetical protein
MKSRRYGLLAAAVLVALAACATKPTDAPQSVFALEGELTTAINVATIYAGLPTCGATVSLCSDPSMVAKLQTAAAAATSAILGAQATVTNGSASASAQTAALVAAAQAVSSLTNLTASVKIP